MCLCYININILFMAVFFSLSMHSNTWTSLSLSLRYNKTIHDIGNPAELRYFFLIFFFSFCTVHCKNCLKILMWFGSLKSSPKSQLAYVKIPSKFISLFWSPNATYTQLNSIWAHARNENISKFVVYNLRTI